MHAWSAILALPLLIHWQGVHFSAPFSGIEHHLGSRDIVPFLVPASADPCTYTVALYWAVHVCLPKALCPLRGFRLRGQPQPFGLRPAFGRVMAYASFAGASLIQVVEHPPRSATTDHIQWLVVNGGILVIVPYSALTSIKRQLVPLLMQSKS